jgi:hypothetical protein
VGSFRIESVKYSYATPKTNPVLRLPGKISGRLGIPHPESSRQTSLYFLFNNSNNIKLSKTPYSPEKKRETIKKLCFFFSLSIRVSEVLL